MDQHLEPYASHADKADASPALVLNTTFVETGQRVAFSPFKLSNLGDAHLTSFAELSGIGQRVGQVRLAEAAIVSARFPGLMPAYSLQLATPASGHWNFVDGGYSDNSGAATASAVMQRLNELLEKEKLALGLEQGEEIEVRLVILTSEVGQPDLGSLKGTSLVDTRAPIEALLNVRSTLAAREISRAVERFRSSWSLGAKEGAWRVGIIGLDQKNFALQLGWTLSRTTNLIVSLFVARPEYCSAQPASTMRQPSEDAIIEAEYQAERIALNACLIRNIIELMETP